MIHRGGIVSTGLVVLSVIIFFLAMGVSPAYGATFRVNELSDAVDVNPGNGVCETVARNKVCTLRAAVQEANALPGRDVIILKRGVYLLTIEGRNELAGATGDLDISDDLVIKGKGSTKTFINGNRLDRVIQVFDAEVVIKDLTIQNGLMEDVVGYGGGISNHRGVVTIVRCSIANNVVKGAEGGYGGGIANGEDGTLVSKNSYILNNTVISGSGFPSQGGGIFSRADASLEIRNSTIADNQAMASGSGGRADGGGLKAEGLVGITGSTIAGNVAFSETNTAAGGGMNLTGLGSTTSNCRIFGNRAVSGGIAGGGGVFQHGGTIEDSMFSDNSATSGGQLGFGGGIFSSDEDLMVRGSTFARNAATNRGGGIYYEGNPTTGSILTIEEGSRIIRNLAGSECGGVYSKWGTVNVSNDSMIKHNSPDDTNF